MGKTQLLDRLRASQANPGGRLNRVTHTKTVDI